MSDTSQTSNDQAWYEAVSCLKKLDEKSKGSFTSILCVDSRGKKSRRLVFELDYEDEE